MDEDEEKSIMSLPTKISMPRKPLEGQTKEQFEKYYNDLRDSFNNGDAQLYNSLLKERKAATKALSKRRQRQQQRQQHQGSDNNISPTDNDIKNNISPTDNDIKFGAGGISQHPGNIWLRSFLRDNYKEIYDQSDRDGKNALRKRIISEIHDSGRSFYMLDDKSNNWHVVNNRNVIGSKITSILSRKEDNNQLLKAKIRKYASVQHNASQKAKDRDGRSTQLSNLSTSDEKSSPKSDAAVEKSAGSTASPKSSPRPVVGASPEQIIRLTKEQCSKVTFPIGCPVWYGFSVKDGDTTTTLKCGVISSAMLRGGQLFYEVEHRNKDAAYVTEQVKDSELCFGASCPVTILPSSDDSGGGDDDKNTSSYCEGEIVLCTLSTTDTKKFVYTAMIFLDGGSRVRYESGIEANRVKYSTNSLVPSNGSI
jgi:hypothetical protein